MSVQIENLACFFLEDCRFCADGLKSVPIRGCERSQKSNGCGASSWSEVALDIVDFLASNSATECCNKHDICYSSCEQTFEKCEQEFRDCLSGVYDGMSLLTKFGGCSAFKNAHNGVCSCVNETSPISEVYMDCNFLSKKDVKN